MLPVPVAGKKSFSGQVIVLLRTNCEVADMEALLPLYRICLLWAFDYCRCLATVDVKRLSFPALAVLLTFCEAGSSLHVHLSILEDCILFLALFAFDI